MSPVANQTKYWQRKGENYNRSMNSGLQDNDTEMYLTHSQQKSVVAERFNRNLKNKICKCMTSV